MNKNDDKILQSATKTLSAVDVGGGLRDPQLAELDRGILQVALMVSGLDGTIYPGEYQAFGEMAKRCRGANRKNVRALYDEAIIKAGQLAGMANFGIYSETERLAEFLRMAMQALPNGFASGSLADLRRAFVLWIAMGLADGAFSGLERKAVKALVRCFALKRAARDRRFTAFIEPDFFAKAEKLLSDVKVASKRAKAEIALGDLISTVVVREKGSKALHQARRISLSIPMPGPTITGWK